MGERASVLLLRRYRNVSGNGGLSGVVHSVGEARVGGLLSHGRVGTPVFRQSKVSATDNVRDRTIRVGILKGLFEDVFFFGDVLTCVVGDKEDRNIFHLLFNLR